MIAIIILPTILQRSRLNRANFEQEPRDCAAPRFSQMEWDTLVACGGERMRLALSQLWQIQRDIHLAVDQVLRWYLMCDEVEAVWEEEEFGITYLTMEGIWRLSQRECMDRGVRNIDARSNGIDVMMSNGIERCCRMLEHPRLQTDAWTSEFISWFSFAMLELSPIRMFKWGFRCRQPDGIQHSMRSPCV